MNNPYYWFLMIPFFVGWLLHVAKAAFNARIDKTNGVNTFFGYFGATGAGKVPNWFALLIRFVLPDQILFWVWIYNPGIFDSTVGTAINAIFHTNVNLATQLAPLVALGWGYLVESAVDVLFAKVPGFSTEIPKLGAIQQLIAQMPQKP